MRAAIALSLLAACAGCEGASTPDPPPLRGAIETEIRLDGCRLLVQVDPGEAIVGDPIRLLVIAEPAPGFVAAIEPWPPALDAFEVSTLPTPRLAGLPPAAVARAAQLRSFEGGLWPIPPLQASFHPRDGGAALSLASNPLSVAIVSVLDEADLAAAPPHATDLRDLKEPLRLADATTWVWWVAGVLVALGGLGALLARRGRREPPARPPHRVALDALDRLAADLPPDPTAARDAWAPLLGVLRSYLQEELGIAATSRTGRELAGALLAAPRLSDRQRQEITRLLRESDLVIFAGSRPDRATSEQAIATVRRLVEETAAGSAAP